MSILELFKYQTLLRFLAFNFILTTLSEFKYNVYLLVGSFILVDDERALIFDNDWAKFSQGQIFRHRFI